MKFIQMSIPRCENCDAVFSNIHVRWFTASIFRRLNFTKRKQSVRLTVCGHEYTKFRINTNIIFYCDGMHVACDGMHVAFMPATRNGMSDGRYSHAAALKKRPSLRDPFRLAASLRQPQQKLLSMQIFLPPPANETLSACIKNDEHCTNSLQPAVPHTI